MLVKNSAGCFNDVAVENNFISGAPVPGFSFSAVCKNAVAKFAGFDLSIENITLWNWSFGDRINSDRQNNLHALTSAGNYPIRLHYLQLVAVQ